MSPKGAGRRARAEEGALEGILGLWGWVSDEGVRGMAATLSGEAQIGQGRRGALRREGLERPEDEAGVGATLCPLCPGGAQPGAAGRQETRPRGHWGGLRVNPEYDRLTTAKWDDWFTGTRDLEDLAVADFEVVEAGERIAWTGDCVRE